MSRRPTQHTVARAAKTAVLASITPDWFLYTSVSPAGRRWIKRFWVLSIVLGAAFWASRGDWALAAVLLGIGAVGMGGFLAVDRSRASDDRAEDERRAARRELYRQQAAAERAAEWRQR